MQYKLNSISKFIFTFVFGIISYLLITPKETFSLFFLLLGVLVFSFILFKLYNFLDSKNNAHIRCLSYSLFAILLIGQIIIAYIFRLEVQLPGWDFNTVVNQAIKLSEEGFSNLDWYFTALPVNIPVAIYLGAVFEFFSWFGIENYNAIGLLLNIVSVDLSIFISYILVKKLVNKQSAVILLFISVLFSPLYFHIPIYYTDTLSMPFLLLLFYLYVYMQGKSKGQLIVWGLISFVAFIGFSLKATLLIMLIAIIIHMFLTQPILKSIGYVILSVSIIFLSNQLYNVAITKAGLVASNYKEMSIPKTHWFMMGLTGIGGWNGEDFDYTNSFSDYESKQEAHLIKIKERLNDMGMIGYVSFLEGKLRYTWTEGTYAAIQILASEKVEENKLHQYVVDPGKNNIFKYVSQIVHMSIIIIIFFGSLLTIKNREITFFDVLRYSMIGLFILLILWETISRYTFNYIPILLMLVCSYIPGLIAFVDSFRTKIGPLCKEEICTISNLK